MRQRVRDHAPQRDAPRQCAGSNGELNYSWTWSSSNTATNKSLGEFISGHGVGGATNGQVNVDTVASQPVRGANGTTLRFQGSTTNAVAEQNGVGDTGTDELRRRQSADHDPAADFLRGWLNSATDWLILQLGSVDAKSSLLTDNPLFGPDTAYDWSCRPRPGARL